MGVPDHIHRVAMVRPAGESSASAAAAYRVLDVGLALALLIALAPLLALVAVILRLESGGPVLARRLCLGLDLEPFTVLTFRNVPVGCAPGRRLTSVGRILRWTRLDCLPQLWNVLRGEMSMVGPRPAIADEVELYQPHWFGRFAVRPGITGLWQVSDQRGGGPKEMMRLDLRYARERSLGLNLRILARTPVAMLRHGGRSTAP